MAVWKKFLVRKPNVARKFRVYKGSVKNVKHLDGIVKQDSALRKVISAVFSKRGLKITAASTVVGVGVSYINNYIQSNSGCFLTSNTSVCKVRDLSCCQPDPVEGVPFCPGIFKKNACSGFNEEKEDSCCRLCDCKYSKCLPDQTLECRRPTIGEALSHYAQGMTSGLLSYLEFFLKIFYWVAGMGVGILAIWLAWKMYQKTR